MMANTSKMPRNAAGGRLMAVTCSAPDPITILEEEHALQRELCDLLEHMADRLSQECPPAQASVARDILAGSYTRHIEFEEQALFPVMRARLAVGDPMEAVIDRLCNEHEHGDAEVVEIIEALADVEAGHKIDNASAFGYLLRSFFEGQRRHIAWEDDVVIPTARRILTDADLGVLQAWIMQSGHPRCCRHSVVKIRAAQRVGSTVCFTCSAAIDPN